MTDQELEALLQDIESDRVERKESLSDSDKIRQAICAFANDFPDYNKAGVIFVGVKDKGGHSGLAITDEILRTLAGYREDGSISPMPAMIVQKRKLSIGEIIAVEVMPADAPPVRLRGRTWIRVGPRRAVASPQEERILSERRRAQDIHFDIRPVYSASLQDLDLERFQRSYLPAAVAPDVLAENNRTIEQQLASLRFVADPINAIPTVVGMLVLGVDVLRFLPGAYVQFLRIQGTVATDTIIDSAVCNGSMADLVAQLDQRMTAHIQTRIEFMGLPTEVKLPSYPLGTLQQLTRNALMHRVYEGTNAPVRVMWYDDRIEIISPGGPYGNVRVDNFGQPGVTDYRNPYLATAMLHLGLVQRFGVGIQKAREALVANGNPALEFQVNESYVMAVVKPKS